MDKYIKDTDNTEKSSKYSEEDKSMKTITNEDRPCTITESIIESCKQVKLMQEGKIPKKTLQDLWDSIEKWKAEDEEK